MKYVITIEETVVKDFEVEACSAEEAYEMAIRNYKSGDFVLDPGYCQFKRMSIMAPSNEAMQWREF